MIPGLNLLPPDQKEVVSEENTIIHWRGSLLLLAAVGVVAIVGLWFANGQLNNRVDQTANQITQQRNILQRTGATDVTDATNRVNLDINLLSQALGSNQSWSVALENILNLIPDRIKISKLSINANRQITIEGVAETRTAFIGFDGILRGTKLLSGVTTTSTASLRENLPFVYHATLVK